MEHPNNVERKSSFNPEAAAFSPTAAEQSEGSTVAAGTAESAHLVSRMTALSRRKCAELRSSRGTEMIPQTYTCGPKTCVQKSSNYQA
jgi:hypothetical protein